MRFIGTRGFMVTFMDIDPLFTFDLTDPTDPKEVGKWVGPGYSTYLHPYGEHLLIAMGEYERSQVGVSLYDLGDFANPIRVAHRPLDGVNPESAALYEHKAFTFNPGTGELLLPFYDWTLSTGVLMYQLADTTIDLLGTMSMEGDISLEGPARRAMYNGDAVIGVGACRLTSAAFSNPTETISTIPISDACELPSWY